jgi:hypothetical protein
LIIFLSTSFKSPTIGMSTGTFFWIEVGSMSMWMILACGANSSTFPVTRSSNRAPTAMIRSLWEIAMFAAYVPCIPSIPMCRGSVLGNAPIPISVVVTGIPRMCARSVSCAEDPERMTPPPA